MRLGTCFIAPGQAWVDRFVAPSGGPAALSTRSAAPVEAWGAVGAHCASTTQPIKLVNSVGTEALEGRCSRKSNK